MKQQRQKRIAPIAIERRGRLIGQHQIGLTDQRASRSHPLLLADAELVGTAMPQFRIQIHRSQQRFGRRPDRARTFAAACGKVTANTDVIEYVQPRQQVELLKDHAQMIGAKTVARGSGKCIQRLTRNMDAAGIGHDQATNQSQQGRFT